MRSVEEVAEVLDEAQRAGGSIVRHAAVAEWGGTSGAFADPDGYVWEVAHNAGWTVRRHDPHLEVLCWRSSVLRVSVQTTDARLRVATYLAHEVRGRTIELDANPDGRPESQPGVGDLAFKSDAGRVAYRGNIDRDVTAHERVREG